MNEVIFSVIVTTYNSDYNKLFKTLNSILVQEGCSFEIIITDDGTKNFDIDLIKKWMEEKKFTNYKIVNNKQNMGTVKNIYQGLLNSSGKYIKGMAPGDYLYAKDTLYNIYKFMQENECNIIFGKAVYYKLNEDNDVEIINKQNPRNIKPYLTDNLKKIKKSYLIYQDYILGAAFAFEKSLLMKYIKKIIDVIVYAEDCSVILMIADNIKVYYLNSNIIWYECNTGISTSGNPEWLKKILEDNKKCFEIISKEHPELRYIYDLHYGKSSFKQKSLKMKKRLVNKMYNIKGKIINKKIIEKDLEIFKNY